MTQQSRNPKTLAARKLAKAFATVASENEAEAFALHDQVELLSYELAAVPAQNPVDIIAKIELWRVVAPEDVFAEDLATPDEALVRSIVEDCERLIQAGCPK